MAVRFRFVDKIDAAPTVRLDLHASPWTLLGSEHGTNFDPPPLKRALADSGVLRDGALQAASAYDNRTVRAALLLEGTSQDLLADDLQDLNRELNRPANILEYRPEGATKSVFFRTYRSPDYELFADLPEAGSSSLRVLVQILAEPFALGLREDTSPTTITNDPAAGSNGHFVDVSSVLGDVITPCVIKDTDTHRDRYVIAARQHGDPTQLDWFTQAEDAGVTLLTDTTNPGGGPDAFMSGTGTNNYVRTSFATATLVNRLRGPVASGSSSGTADEQARALRGIYRVFVVVRRSDNTSVMNIKWRYGTSTLDPESDLVTLPLTASRQLVDMGLVYLGGAVPANVGYGSVDSPISAARELVWFAERTSGAGTLDWDCWLLFPADEQMMLFAQGDGNSTEDLVIDGLNEYVFQVEAGGNLFDGTGTLRDIRAEVAGSFPVLVPNQTNRFWVMASDSAAEDNTITKTWTFAWTFSYWPRWLYIRP